MNASTQGILAYLVQVISVTFTQIVTLMGPWLILVAIVSVLSGLVQRFAIGIFGVVPYLLLFGWLGTAIHEAGHAIVGMLFGINIVHLELFKPNLKTGQLGVTGFINDRNSLIKQIGLFFMCVGPIILGTFVIFASLFILFEHDMFALFQYMSDTTQTYTDLAFERAPISDVLLYCSAILAFIFSPAHVADWRFYLFLYVAFAIGSSMRLSPPDIAGAISGFTVLVVFWLLFNLATLGLGDLSSNLTQIFGQLSAFGYVILVLAIMLDLIVLAVLFLPALLLRTLTSGGHH